MSLSNHFTLSRLRDQLFEHRRRILTAAFLSGVVEALCAQLILLPILGWESFRHPYAAGWLKGILASYGVYIWPLISWQLAKQRRSFRIERLAGEIDRFNPGAPDVYRTLLSLPNHGPQTLVALDRLYSGWESRLRIPRIPYVGRARLRWLALCGFFALGLPAVSGHFGGVASRMAIPVSIWKNIPVPRLAPFGLPDRVALGDTVRVLVRVERLPASEPVYAHVGFHGREERYPMERKGDTAWFMNGPVPGDITIHFSALQVKTAEYRIRAVPPPYLRSLSVVLRFPAYTRLPEESMTEAPAVFTALPGTRISWRARSSLPLRKLLAVFRESDSARPDTMDLGHGSNFDFQRLARKSCELRFRLFTEDGLSGNAGPYRIEPGVDAPPEIAILSPSGDGELGRSLKIPVVFRVRDDYGITSVRLRYSVFAGERNSAVPGVVDISSWLQPASGMGGGVWELGDLQLQPGNVVEVYLEATDNDDISGPKTARSGTIKLRMPSLEQVLAGMDAGERGAITSLRSAVEREQGLRNDRGKMTGQIPSDAPPQLESWEIRRILNAAPQDHLKRLERHLDAEAAKINRDSPLGRQLESLRKDAREMEKHLPPPEAWQKPLPEQRRWLDTLTRNQQKLDQRLSDLKPLPPPSEPGRKEPLAEERKSLQEELRRNMREQHDLQTWMKEQEQNMNAQRRDLERSAQAEQQAREDVKQAMSQLQKTLEKGMENGALSPELLEKMERIQELLKENLPDSTLDRLRRDAENQQVGMEELQRNLKDLLDRREDMRQGLDRAIRMLEMLRDMRTLEKLANEVHQMQGEQDQLAGRMDEGGTDDQQLASRQSVLRQRLENARRELNRLATEQKPFQGLKDQPHAQQAERNMRAAENALKKKAPERAQAGQSAKSAANELKQMAGGMDDVLNQMQGGPDPSEIAEVLDETMEFGRWQELIRDKKLRVREGWVEEDPALNQRAAQLARWLRSRMEKLAARQPFKSEVLRREASELGFQADALLASNHPAAAGDSLLLMHTRKAARELLKWLKQANDDEGGSMGGLGSGTKSRSGKGKGQGEGEDEGLDGMVGRLRGVSGKQMAVNQATYQLLQQFMAGRRSGGSSPGQGTEGSQSLFGGSRGARPDVLGRDGNNPSGSEQGSTPGSGSREGGNTTGGAANSQQGIGESLERMAESASDAGGAARKLRQLAEEARNLERDLRQGRLDPEEMRQKQERFQTRLLEAANAMEERGQNHKLQAEAYRGGPLKPDSTMVLQDEDVFRELRRRRDEARSLALPVEQKRQIEWYYENLLMR